MPTYQETPTHVIVTTDDGQVLPVAKAGLSPSQLDALGELTGVPGVAPPRRIAPYSAPAVSPETLQNLKGGKETPFSPPPASEGEQLETAKQRALQNGNVAEFKRLSAEGVAKPESPKPSTPASGPSSGPAGLVTQFAMGASGPAGGGGYAPRANLGAIDKAATDEQKAIQETADIAKRKAVEDHAYQEERVTQAQAFELRQQQQLADRQKMVGEQTKKLEGLVEEYGKPAPEVNPDRWWGSRSTGQKMLAAIGVALGGLGRGQNESLGLINKAIDDDISAQRENIRIMEDRQGKRVAAQSNLLAIMRQNFDDDDLAEKATRIAQLQTAEEKAKALEAKYAGQTTQANANRLSAQIAGQAAKEKVEFQLKLDQLGLQAQQAQTERANLVLKAQAQLQKTSGENSALIVRGKDGTLGYATDKDAAKTAREAVAEHDKTVAKVDRLIKLREKFGAETLDRSAVTEMQSLATEVVGDLNRTKKFGALDKGAQEMLGKMTGGDPAAFGYVLPALQSVRRSLEEDLVANVTPYLNPQAAGAAPSDYRTLKPYQAPQR